MKRNIAYFVLVALLAGCSSMQDLIQGEKIQYKSESRQLPRLEIPPDLTSPSRDDRYAVPDVNTQGSATLSTYNVERGGALRAGSTEILPDVAKVRIERAGSERWLVVPEAPEKVWPGVKEVWQGLGIMGKIERRGGGGGAVSW